MSESRVSKLLDDNIKFEQEILLERTLLLDKALRSSDPEDIIKANQYWSQIKKDDTLKSFIIDPFEVNGNGWKNNRGGLNPSVLRAMGQTPYVRAVVGTRVEQVADFATPQTDSIKPGWIVRKRVFGTPEKKKKADIKEQKIVEEITKFLFECGSGTSKDQNGRSFQWTKDVTFETFLRKITKDSLELDNACFEIGETRNGDLSEFMAIDGATVFIAEDYERSNYSESERKAIRKYGYYPSNVQVLQGQVVAEYYPWELCYGIRNPSTELWRGGYGNPELTSLVGTVTSLLNADSYNSNFFKVGSHPKGLLAVKGGLNQNQLDDFRQQWRSQVMGVMNAHKLPVINSDKVEFINTQMGNKDMEFNEFFQFLIRLLCVLYKMSPVEVGLDTQGGSSLINNSNNTEEEITYSKEKGLKPLLRFFERKVNKYLVQRKWPDFEFVFVGLDPEDSSKLQDIDIKAVQNYETLNEVRKRRDLPPIKDLGDMVLNPLFYQAQTMKQQTEQQQQGQQQQGQQDDGQGGQQGYWNGQDDGQGGQQDDGQEQENNPFQKSNPITDSFNSYIDRLKHSDS